MATKASGTTRTKKSATAKRRTKTAAATTPAVTTPTVLAKELPVAPVLMKSPAAPPVAHLAPHAKPAAPPHCTHCRTVPLSAFTMVGLLTGLVLALSVFLIDASTLL
jgi:hypothetical protein